MSDSIHLKHSHILLASSSEVDAICRPLKEAFNVTSFVYQRNFNDGSEIKLSNQPDWNKHFYEQGLYRLSGFEKHPDHYQTGLVVWSHLSHHQPILNAARHFNIDHGMTLIQKKPDGCEFYFIGTTPDKPFVTNLLLNNLDLLSQFTSYFKEQAAPLLKKANSERIFIPQKHHTVKSMELGIPYKTNMVTSNNIFNVKKLYLDNHQTLSQREIACAKLLLQGKSARLIAEQLFLSPRTIETHIQHLKEKLNCRSKAELINCLLKLHL